MANDKAYIMAGETSCEAQVKVVTVSKIFQLVYLYLAINVFQLPGEEMADTPTVDDNDRNDSNPTNKPRNGTRERTGAGGNADMNHVCDLVANVCMIIN